MDPNACLARIIEASKGTDRTEYACACEELADWLRRGGFKPTIPADMRWIPGTGTRWSVLSPGTTTHGRWVLRHYDCRGNTQESFVLD
jgi:hypothetical protein